MKKLAVILAAVASVAACQRTPTEPARVPLRSSISTADPTAAQQLVHGFYQVENNAWRWAAGHFSFELQAPGDADSGTHLVIDVALPEEAFKNTQSVTLTCRGRTPLKPEVYTKAGSYTYERDLEPFKGSRLRVNCEVDHTLPTGPVDKRELAIIVSQMSIEPR